MILHLCRQEHVSTVRYSSFMVDGWYTQSVFGCNTRIFRSSACLARFVRSTAACCVASWRLIPHSTALADCLLALKVAVRTTPSACRLHLVAAATVADWAEVGRTSTAGLNVAVVVRAELPAPASPSLSIATFRRSVRNATCLRPAVPAARAALTFSLSATFSSTCFNKQLALSYDYKMRGKKQKRLIE